MWICNFIFYLKYYENALFIKSITHSQMVLYLPHHYWNFKQWNGHILHWLHDAEFQWLWHVHVGDTFGYIKQCCLWNCFVRFSNLTLINLIMKIDENFFVVHLKQYCYFHYHCWKVHILPTNQKMKRFW